MSRVFSSDDTCFQVSYYARETKISSTKIPLLDLAKENTSDMSHKKKTMRSDVMRTLSCLCSLEGYLSRCPPKILFLSLLSPLHLDVPL